jgi:hypothetical protein
VSVIAAYCHGGETGVSVSAAYCHSGETGVSVSAAYCHSGETGVSVIAAYCCHILLLIRNSAIYEEVFSCFLTTENVFSCYSFRAMGCTSFTKPSPAQHNMYNVNIAHETDICRNPLVHNVTADSKTLDRSSIDQHLACCVFTKIGKASFMDTTFGQKVCL